MLKKHIKELELEKDYKSIIDADVSLFGLLYLVLIEGKTIKTDSNTVPKLQKELQEEISKAKCDVGSKNPNLLKYLRQRLYDSYCLYSRFVKR